jgi:hypothetical protein
MQCHYFDELGHETAAADEPIYCIVHAPETLLPLCHLVASLLTAYH